ncbi:hypothetical protein [Halorubrum halodurans]|uniref:Uncharacterized protein n=1 Tax=Halorubrum halodurans TaxID=1383851 RepID=A0A256IQD8_9EURY|nr:hypothetical protein [Halorubrum halodurans]OYR58506.1 hypothetical protein DJ70_03020 [Halorubrum halodurans]
MSATEFDPNDTVSIAYDDRNGDFDPDFEMYDELAFNIGWDTPEENDDPEAEAQMELEARLEDSITGDMITVDPDWYF